MERIQCQNVFHHVASHRHWVLPNDCWITNRVQYHLYSTQNSARNLVDSFIERYRTATTAEEKKEAYLLLCNTANRVEDLLTRFKQETSSKLFKFWDKYIEMILLLLEFIRAEREGDWELHLKVTTKMIPYFFCNGSRELLPVAACLYYGYAQSARKSSRRLQRVP